MEIQIENDQLLTLNHQIREIEHSLNIARQRRRWSNLSLVFGPILGVILYSMLWIPWISREIIWAIYIPAIPIAIAFCIASYLLKRNPGGPATLANGDKVRLSEGELELELARHRDTRKLVVASADVPSKVRRITYKEDAYADIDQLRTESKGYRRVNNILQGILIIGSLAATGASAIATELPIVRWVTVGITFLVGISSGFMGYFKYKERSFYLQQTADAIESEWEAVEIGVGRYKRIDDEEERLAEFVEEVHRLKSEQKKRQQNLEQPPESRDPNE
jgi:MFS family permease